MKDERDISPAIYASFSISHFPPSINHPLSFSTCFCEQFFHIIVQFLYDHFIAFRNSGIVFNINLY
jgi:hypothetical protein